MADNKSNFTTLTPAKTIEEVWQNFDPTLIIDPASEQYIPRTDPELQKLSFNLKHSRHHIHAFLCGHRGSGKTTELNRLCLDEKITQKFSPIFFTAQEFGSDGVHLTHDAIMVGIGQRLIRNDFIDAGLKDEFNDWGKTIVKTFLKDEKAQANAGAKANAWIAFFKAQLSTRKEWKYEQKQILEPKVQDLIGILNRMAQDLKNKTGKKLLIVVDDLEKGESEAHKEMHKRLFKEHYDTLVQPAFSIVYTLPIYFRAMQGSRIPNDQLYTFSAIRLYDHEHRKEETPELQTEDDGYKLIRNFVEKRMANLENIFADDDVLNEILLIGGGLFRETARVIKDAAYFAISRDADKIELEDAKKVFSQVKKEYQPMVRGEAIPILKEVAETGMWVDGVEPFLQSRAVVEYENGDLWIDIRYVLKKFIGELPAKESTE
ncbi:MAG: AAA family ATPase [Desulfobacteraceae bacterium]|nr:AAA family ATPase [Desulfobacteraceae bacterium]